MANFTTKSIKEIYDGFIASYSVMRSKYVKDGTPLLDKSLVKSIGYALSGVAGCIWKQLVWSYKQVFPQSCDLPALKLWGNLVGVDYKDGQSANLTIVLSDVTAQYLQTGTVYKDLDSGLIFKTISRSNAVDGVIEATVECSESGTVGNLSVDTVLNIANPFDGIPQTATVKAVTIQGSEDEDVESYRKRVLYRFRNKSQCGSPLDYYTWGMETSGIVDILVYVLNEGIVSLFPIASGSGKNRTISGSLSPNPYPVWENGQFKELTGSGQMLELANKIEGSTEGVHDRRPTMAKVKIEDLKYTGFEVEISGLSSEKYNEQIKNVLISLLDKKRPHNVVLGYSEANGKINKLQLSASITDVIEGETFTSILLRNSEGESIDEATLDVGCVAYLMKLTINNQETYKEESENE